MEHTRTTQTSLVVTILLALAYAIPPPRSFRRLALEAAGLISRTPGCFYAAKLAHRIMGQTG